MVATPKDLHNSRSDQLTPAEHNATVSPVLYPNEYNQHSVDSLVFQPSSIWEHTSTPSLFGEESTNGTFATQNHGLNELGSQSRVVGSYFRVPQISGDTNWGPLFSFDDQATMAVSSINPMYLQLAWKLRHPCPDYPLIPSFRPIPRHRALVSQQEMAPSPPKLHQS